MNISKTIKRALECGDKPAKALRYVAELEACARVRGNLAALHAEIERDVAPELAAMRRADEFFSACVGRPRGPVHCACEPGSLSKYNVEYGQGVIPSNLAKENSEFAGLYRESMDKAREHTQTTAGGNHSQD